jgi:hypothetical protein
LKEERSRAGRGCDREAKLLEKQDVGGKRRRKTVCCSPGDFLLHSETLTDWRGISILEGLAEGPEAFC